MPGYQRRRPIRCVESGTLTEWARGCLFLRAYSETGGNVADVAQAVSAYRTQLRKFIEDIVPHQIGAANDDLVEQIFVLFEGATSTFTDRGTSAISTARAIAAVLMDRTDQTE